MTASQPQLGPLSFCRAASVGGLFYSSSSSTSFKSRVSCAFGTRAARVRDCPVEMTGQHGPKRMSHGAVTLSPRDRQSCGTASRRRHADANVIAG
jgi:hypothetical protein